MKSTTKIKKSPAPATSASLAPAPAPKIKESVAFAPASAPTVIKAEIDVGFGNTLYLRGDGPGLSWNKGVPLDCTADDQWKISIAGAKGPVTFKFLLNDETWSKGEDYVAAPGATVSLSPAF